MGASLCMGDWFGKIFKSFDKDGSGFLDASQLSSFLTQALKHVGINHNVSSTQAKFVLKQLDKNHDGKLNEQQTYQIFSYFKDNFTSITGKMI